MRFIFTTLFLVSFGSVSLAEEIVFKCNVLKHYRLSLKNNFTLQNALKNIDGTPKPSSFKFIVRDDKTAEFQEHYSLDVLGRLNLEQDGDEITYQKFGITVVYNIENNHLYFTRNLNNVLHMQASICFLVP